MAIALAFVILVSQFILRIEEKQLKNFLLYKRKKGEKKRLRSSNSELYERRPH